MQHWLHTFDPLTRATLWLPVVAFMAVAALIALHLWHAPARRWTWKALAGVCVVMFLVQPYLALVWSPPERFMGDTMRILYMHVPQLWASMLALSINFGCSIAYLFRKSFVTDSLAEATAEVGVFFGTVGVLLGAIWARPTWGAWWTWDPRLTTSAILIVIYTGYLAMRRFVEDPEKRATWASVMGIIAFVDIPVLWYSVKWWRSMHQVQSTAATLDPKMIMAWRFSSVMFLALTVVFIYQRYLVAQANRTREVALPDELPSASPLTQS